MPGGPTGWLAAPVPRVATRVERPPRMLGDADAPGECAQRFAAERGSPAHAGSSNPREAPGSPSLAAWPKADDLRERHGTPGPRPSPRDPSRTTPSPKCLRWMPSTAPRMAWRPAPSARPETRRMRAGQERQAERSSQNQPLHCPLVPGCGDGSERPWPRHQEPPRRSHELESHRCRQARGETLQYPACAFV